MEKPSYKVIIPIVAKDLDLIKNNISYFQKNLGAKGFVFIGKKTIERECLQIPNSEFIDEDSVMSELTFSKCRELINKRHGNTQRAGWYFQQFLKIGYSTICKEEYYLVWDSDTIPIRRIDFFDEMNRPYLSTKNYVKYDECYSASISMIFQNKISKSKDYSFIAEHMMFKKDLTLNLISLIENNHQIKGETFFEKIINSIPQRIINLSGFSEFETYASFLTLLYPNIYQLRKWNNIRCGKIFIGPNPSTDLLQWVSKHFASISIERYDSYWLIFKYLNKANIFKYVKFENIYNLFIPLINIIYTIRLYLRNILKPILKYK